MRQNAHNIWVQFAYIDTTYMAADVWETFAWSWEKNQDSNGNRIHV